ncbi:MAG: hypothetical protein RR123_02615 [Clostridia bacterium]
MKNKNILKVMLLVMCMVLAVSLIACDGNDKTKVDGELGLAGEPTTTYTSIDWQSIIGKTLTGVTYVAADAATSTKEYLQIDPLKCHNITNNVNNGIVFNDKITANISADKSEQVAHVIYKMDDVDISLCPKPEAEQNGKLFVTLKSNGQKFSIDVKVLKKADSNDITGYKIPSNTANYEVNIDSTKDGKITLKSYKNQTHLPTKVTLIVGGVDIPLDGIIWKADATYNFGVTSSTVEGYAGGYPFYYEFSGTRINLNVVTSIKEMSEIKLEDANFNDYLTMSKAANATVIGCDMYEISNIDFTKIVNLPKKIKVKFEGATEFEELDIKWATAISDVASQEIEVEIGIEGSGYKKYKTLITQHYATDMQLKFGESLNKLFIPTLKTNNGDIVGVNVKDKANGYFLPTATLSFKYDNDNVTIKNQSVNISNYDLSKLTDAIALDGGVVAMPVTIKTNFKEKKIDTAQLVVVGYEGKSFKSFRTKKLPDGKTSAITVNETTDTITIAEPLSLKYFLYDDTNYPDATSNVVLQAKTQLGIATPDAFKTIASTKSNRIYWNLKDTLPTHITEGTYNPCIGVDCILTPGVYFGSVKYKVNIKLKVDPKIITNATAISACGLSGFDSSSGSFTYDIDSATPLGADVTLDKGYYKTTVSATISGATYANLPARINANSFKTIASTNDRKVNIEIGNDYCGYQKIELRASANGISNVSTIKYNTNTILNIDTQVNDLNIDTSKNIITQLYEKLGMLTVAFTKGSDLTAITKQVYPIAQNATQDYCYQLSYGETANVFVISIFIDNAKIVYNIDSKKFTINALTTTKEFSSAKGSIISAEIGLNTLNTNAEIAKEIANYYGNITANGWTVNGVTKSIVFKPFNLDAVTRGNLYYDVAVVQIKTQNVLNGTTMQPNKKQYQVTFTFYNDEYVYTTHQIEVTGKFNGSALLISDQNGNDLINKAKIYLTGLSGSDTMPETEKIYKYLGMLKVNYVAGAVALDVNAKANSDGLYYTLDEIRKGTVYLYTIRIYQTNSLCTEVLLTTIAEYEFVNRLYATADVNTVTSEFDLDQTTVGDQKEIKNNEKKEIQLVYGKVKPTEAEIEAQLKKYIGALKLNITFEGKTFDLSFVSNINDAIYKASAFKYELTVAPIKDTVNPPYVPYTFEVKIDFYQAMPHMTNSYKIHTVNFTVFGKYEVANVEGKTKLDLTAVNNLGLLSVDAISAKTEIATKLGDLTCLLLRRQGSLTSYTFKQAYKFRNPEFVSGYGYDMQVTKTAGEDYFRVKITVSFVPVNPEVFSVFDFASFEIKVK